MSDIREIIRSELAAEKAEAARRGCEWDAIKGIGAPLPPVQYGPPPTQDFVPTAFGWAPRGQEHYAGLALVAIVLIIGLSLIYAIARFPA